MGWVAKLHPTIEAEAADAMKAQDPGRIEKVFEEAVTTLLADAANGSIEIDGGFVTALRGIKFDHQHGTVTMGGTTVRADILVTGGGTGATGTTDILGNSVLRSRGTEIKLGNGASIKLTGNASIKQS